MYQAEGRARGNTLQWGSDGTLGAYQETSVAGMQKAKMRTEM